MAVPKRRKSKAAKGKRRSHDAYTPMNLTVCPMCKQAVPPHKVHAECLDELLKTGNPNRIRLT